MIVIYSCSLVAVIITTTLSSCSDPSDEVMIRCKNG